MLQSNTVFHNVTIRTNSFNAPALFIASSNRWANPFVVVGNVAGGYIGGNQFQRSTAASDDDKDLELFANAGLVLHNNVCSANYSDGTSVGGAGSCVVWNNSYVSP